MHAKGQIREGNARIFESIVGSRFAGFVASETNAGNFNAITARVSGRAYYSGKAEYIVEEDDPLGQGFLVL
jgi:proline racemase